MLSRLALPIVVLAALAYPASAMAAADVQAARGCSLSSGEQRGGLGATYTSNLRVKRTSCGKGKSVARGFNNCRKGKKAKNCNPSGFNCRESHVANSSVQRSARVKCKKGGKVVKFAYTQNK
jgi:hypothetical protein